MSKQLHFTHRLATLADLPDLKRLMEAAIRVHIGALLDPVRVEASFEIMGVDTTLIEDGTYFVVECEGRIAGCGGWSRRATMFGGDHSKGRRAVVGSEYGAGAGARDVYASGVQPDGRRAVGADAVRGGGGP